MENLLEETIGILKQNNKTVEDVKWVGGQSVWMTWEVFASNADFKYDDGFGGQEIASDLIVVGDEWWLERAEYDGSEWWEFKTMPKQPTEQLTGKFNLKAKIGWKTIAELNG